MIFTKTHLMRKKIKEWLWRYGPAEIISLPATLIPAHVVLQQSSSHLGAAIAGTWGGNIGYFGTILLCDIRSSRKKNKAAGRHYGLAAFRRTVQLLLIEFGLAEILDSFLVRPALMYYLPRWSGDFSAGILIAKFAADLSFYLPAIFFYEWSRKRFP